MKVNGKTICIMALEKCLDQMVLYIMRASLRVIFSTEKDNGTLIKMGMSTLI
jgi:hypothetical protein